MDAGFDAALGEMRAGRKRGHWIWYIFPQLSGLGSSGLAEMYGIDGRTEAIAYLHDPALRHRLLTIATTVAEYAKRGASLLALMNSRIDVLKLVSSLTLFEAVGRELCESDEEPETLALARAAAAVLDAAQAEGYPRCPYTLEFLAHEPPGRTR